MDRARGRLCQGCQSPWNPILEAPSTPKAPKPVSFTIVQAVSLMGFLQVQWQHCPGKSFARAGLALEIWTSLPAAGLASALLRRFGPQEGSQGTIRLGATPLHFEVGSQGSVLARAPLRGGLGIWKEGRRGSKQSWHLGHPGSQHPGMRAKGQGKTATGLGSSFSYPAIHSPTHSCLHPLVHSSPSIHPCIHSCI